ncbi:hypothetical protein [Methylomonas sp. AM2-LC]|uniref:hypothetical protein n=1 Tax=Methylomonas sp. AM2-LC TaxID=3153301 RepID=UPI0032643EB5
MSDFIISPNPDASDFLFELANIDSMVSSVDLEFIHHFFDCAKKASALANGYIKKILWDDAKRYPECSLGVIQYSVRPYVQGFGCDGTTDANIHLIGIHIFSKLGLDYLSAYSQAYNSEHDNIDWLIEIASDKNLKLETVLPNEIGPNEIGLLLHDLYQINCRSFVEVIENILKENNIEYSDWS